MKLNDIIYELAYQAGCTKHSYHNDKDPTLDGYIISREVLDKFAELIIKECCEVADNNIIHSRSPFPSVYIKEHFEEQDESFFCPSCGIENPTVSCGLPNCGMIVGVEND